jgi:hypothetical protein
MRMKTRLKTRYTCGVARDLRRIFLACLVMGGMACAEVDDVPGGEERRDAAAVVPYDGGPDNALGCGKTLEEFTPHPADVLLLLDRSGSMETASGSGTRYEEVAGLLSDLVRNYAPFVRFGYQEMPGRQGCQAQLGGACCASPPLVSVADDSAQAVVDAIAAAAPVDGSTPTAASLQAALAYYDTLADGVDNRLVLLVTDGAPNCTVAGTLASADVSGASGAACTDALLQVNALVALGVRVMVVQVGEGSSDDTSDVACLDALAQAGGAAASPGSPGFFVASDVQAIQLAIGRMVAGAAVPTCLLRLDYPVDDQKPFVVFFDGQQIPASAWMLDSSQTPPTLHITGTYCQKLQEFQASIVEARYGCMTCVAGEVCISGGS